MFHVEQSLKWALSEDWRRVMSVLFHVEHWFIVMESSDENDSFDFRASLSFPGMFHVEHLLRRLKSGGGISPFCSLQDVKSHDDALRRGGVPVLSLIN